MKRNFLTALALASIGVCAPAVHAATASYGIEVSFALTSKCESRAAAAVSMGTAYTAFSSTAVTETLQANFRCTRGLGTTATASLDATTGVYKGVSYTLSVGARDITLNFNDGAYGQITRINFPITLTIAAKQAGDVDTPDDVVPHTLTLSY